ncbi:hypothetical protein ANN_06144, partial [Periplaneta americana]
MLMYFYFAACIPQRYVLAIMGFLAIANAYTMRICLSVAITEMVVAKEKNETEIDPEACAASPSQESTVADHRDFDWDEETQGLILSSFFWGYIITHIPGGILAEKFGGKYALGLGILSTAVFTLLTPLAATEGGAGWLIAVRVIEGLGEGSTFPAMNALLAHWVPPQQRAALGSFVFAGAQVGTVVGTALSGVLLQYSPMGWPSVFYLFGSLGVVWFIVWIFVGYNDPQSHPFISDEEKMFLEKTIESLNRSENGFLTALPYLVMWISSIITGWICDFLINKGYVSITIARKIFTTIASVGPAVGMIAASYAGCDRTAVVALITMGTALMGAFYPGMKVNALDLSPNYAGTLMAIVNGIGAISGIVTPYLVGVLTPNHFNFFKNFYVISLPNVQKIEDFFIIVIRCFFYIQSTIQEWRIVFWVVLGVFFVTNVIFIILGSGELQPWNNPNTMRGGTEEKGQSRTITSK